MLPVNIGDTSLAPQMQPIDPNSIQTQLPQRRGMFGGGNVGNAISAGLNGFLAGMYPRDASSFLAPQMQQQRIRGEMMAQANLQNMEFQRQLALLPLQAQLKLMYPDNEDAQLAYQAGIMPGTPQWQQYMKQIANNRADPLTTIPGGGMAPASVARSMIGANQPMAPVGKLIPIDGGPTPQASGGFR